ncbi:ADP-forming succinate--CoA ligase subunit beta [Gammaproteobacteria bacterium]|nr:ADP-forming succinate--CoA ligase subunit beta [Gammaproteobacteria bacterium]
MDLQEYRAKKLLAEYQVNTAKGVVISHVDEVDTALAELATDDVVVKAQILSGGRGKVGGVRVVSHTDAKAVVQDLIGQRLVTKQTTAEGLPVNQILIEEATQIQNEFYLAFLLDRTHRAVTLLASREGGMDIEEVAEKHPSAIASTVIYDQLHPYHVRHMADILQFTDKSLFSQLYTLIDHLYKLFLESELTLLEVNPLVLTADQELLCLDAKMNVDANALMRLSEIATWRDLSQENPKEVEAASHGLSYIALEGDIGCMVNGAGLAMATMDTIKLHGGNPANFLDVGGDATEERVMQAFKIIGQDQNVKVILVNIFGGIVRCDLIANGILSALAQIEIDKPIVVRLQGHNAEKGQEIIKSSKLNVYAIESFSQAAKKAVALSKE